MGSAVLDDAFGDFLVQSGLERMSVPGIYRGTHRSESIPEGQNVFVSIGDSDDLSVMAPIGQADQINTDDLDVARDPDDRCSLSVVGSFGALIRPLDVNDFVTQPGNLIERAIELAEYAYVVQWRLARNQKRKLELLERLQDWSNDYESVSYGRVSPDDFEATVREVLTLIPKQGLLDEILKDSMNENMRHWLTTGINMSESPWHDIVQRLETIKAEYGWVSEVTQNFIQAQSDVGDQAGRGENGRGKVWDTGLNVVGSVEADGSVWDANLTKLGSVDERGYIWTTALHQIGSVDDGGKIWNSSLEVLGSVDGQGTIWNTTLNKVGSVDHGITAQQAGAAARLLLLV